MANTFYLKQGNTYPNFLVKLLDDNGDGVGLTGSTVLFRMSKKGTDNLMIEREAVIMTQTGDDIGNCYFVFEDGDTDITGTYKAEWEVTFPTGKIATFPRGAGELFNEVVIQKIVD